MTEEARAVTVGDALYELVPQVIAKVIPVSVPVASIGLRVEYPDGKAVTYAPALEVWWAFDDEVTDLTETSVADTASIEAVISLIAFDLGMHLIDGDYIVGKEKSAEGDIFGSLIDFLIVTVESGEADAASMASLYLSLLNAELADAQLADEAVRE